MATYPCDDCYKAFKSKEALISHCDALGHYPTWECDQCFIPFANEKQYQSHCLGLHASTYCDVCKKHFVNQSALHQHLQNSRIHRCCRTCQQEFTSGDALKNHYKSSPSHDTTLQLRNKGFANMVKCDKCDAHFDNANSLKNHSLMHKVKPTNGLASSLFAQSHPSAAKNLTRDMSTQTTKYRCEECDENFNDDEELQRHADHSPFHQGKILDCIECNLIFKSQVELLSHIESKPHKTRFAIIVL